MESGMMPATAVDTLLSFGYTVPGVANVTLEILQENKVVNYDITLTPKAFRLHRWTTYLSKGGIFKKIIALILVTSFKAPKPGVYREYVTYSASSYLPSNFQVNVNVRQ